MSLLSTDALPGDPLDAIEEIVSSELEPDRLRCALVEKVVMCPELPHEIRPVLASGPSHPRCSRNAGPMTKLPSESIRRAGSGASPVTPQGTFASQRQLKLKMPPSEATSQYPWSFGEEAIPTIGALRCALPMEPSNAASPKLKMPPSEATSQ
jgi:hypothetical protein